MTNESVPLGAPTVRAIVWRGYPLHFVIPAVVAVLGVAMLWLGGAAAFFGAWWLATALPIAIGGLFRNPRLVWAPVALWVAWLAVGAAAGPDAGLANTPVIVAAALAAIGAGATYVAQRAVFPATDPETLEATARAVRTPPTLESELASPDTAPPEPLPVEESEDLDPALAQAIEVAEETEIESVEAAGDDADEAEATPEAEAESNAASEPDADEAPETAPEADAADEPEPEPAETADAEPAAEAAPEPVHELPVDADPAPLDEGGHVEEFAAITEADLAKAAAETLDDEAAPLPAATEAGRKHHP